MFILDQLFKKLFKQLNEYFETKVEINKLKMVDKGADLVSSIITKLVIVFLLAQIILLANIGLGVLLGYLFGNMWLGFFTVAAFYLVILLVLSWRQKTLLQLPVKNFFIRLMLK